MPFNLREHIRHLRDWLGRVVSQPRDELNRWQAMVRFAYDLGRYGARQLRQDRAPQMAAALSFRTLFGLLPVIVVGTVLLKAMQGTTAVQNLVLRIAEAIGLQNFSIVTESNTQTGTVEKSMTLAQWLQDLAGKTAELNLVAIGWVGFAVLAYSAVSLIVTIENSFNTICRAPEGRSWLHRLTMYWTVLTLGCAGIAVSFYVDSRFDAWIESATGAAWIIKGATFIWSFAAAGLVVFLFYKLVPNTRVSTRAAIIGALVAAILLEVGKRTLGVYLENALSIRQLYGSLGLIPLFMFWVYLMWLVMLFGLEVAATFQMLRGRRFDEVEQSRPQTGLIDPAIVVALMETVARDFQEGRASTSERLAQSAGIPESLVAILIIRLIDAGYLYRLAQDEAAVTLTKPPEIISANELLAVGFQMVDEVAREDQSGLLDRLREAQLSLASSVTLGRLLKPSQPENQVSAGE